jgi:hypothetical protein
MNTLVPGHRLVPSGSHKHSFQSRIDVVTSTATTGIVPNARMIHRVVLRNKSTHIEARQRILP